VPLAEPNMTSRTTQPNETPALVIYDGECFFCQNYAALVRLKASVGTVELLDARSNDPRVAAYWQQGYDLNEGMLFVYGGRVFHGHEATRVLATLSSSDTLFSALNRLALSSPIAARLSYPLLKLGRLASLTLRGKRLLDDPRGKRL
jgi:predicted DCC family thiol-disulfide oxidoreductase YuxK